MTCGHDTTSGCEAWHMNRSGNMPPWESKQIRQVWPCGVQCIPTTAHGSGTCGTKPNTSVKLTHSSGGNEQENVVELHR